jgi:DNA repair protein RecO (recombination protein O)
VTVPYHRTSGVVMRCTEYSESSQVAAILTPDLGQIHALAKGARRPRKDGRGALDLLDYCDLVLALRPAGQLHILADWSLRERFPRLRADLGRIWVACYALEIALATTTESAEDGAVCHDLVDLLRNLDRGPFDQAQGRPERSRMGGAEAHLALFRFLFRALRTLGHVPATENCTQCGGPLHGHTRFSPASGGALCGDCAGPDPSAFAISRGSLAVMTRLAAEGPGTPLRVTRDQIREIRRAFNDQIQYHLGKPLRAERFLAEV